MSENSEESADAQIEILKGFVIGIINAALMARELDSEDRVRQYRDDFLLLTEDLTINDLVQGASLIGDVAAALVATIASMHKVSPEEAMTYLANEIMSTGAVGDGT